MNLNLIVKSAVATVLLSAASSSAFATSVTPPASGPTPAPGFGPGGVVVEVWDTTTGTSLAEWLGGDTSTFGTPAATPAGGETLDYGILGGSTTFNSLFSSAEVTAGNVKFVVEGANDFTPASPTVDTTVATLGTVRGSGVISTAQSLNTGIASVLNSSVACNSANPCTATTTSSPTNAVTNLGLSTIGGAHTSGSAGGAALDFYQFVDTGSTGSTVAPVQFGNATGAATWTLSATGDLSYAVPAPVPLPAAVWLLGSGLLGLAGVGRRKALSQAV